MLIKTVQKLDYKTSLNLFQSIYIIENMVSNYYVTVVGDKG